MTSVLCGHLPSPHCLTPTYYIFMSPVTKIPQCSSFHVPHKPFIPLRLTSLTVSKDFPKCLTYLKWRHTPPRPGDSGCITWLCSSRMDAVLPSDHPLLCLFWQVLFLAFSRALFSLLCSLSHQSTSSWAIASKPYLQLKINCAYLCWADREDSLMSEYNNLLLSKKFNIFATVWHLST